MTTLIFATHDDASPLIHLEAERAQVVEMLCHTPTWWRNSRPTDTAVNFLRALSIGRMDRWQPRLESTPIFNVEACTDFTVAVDYGDLIAWNPETWTEWDLGAPDKVATTDFDPDFAEVSVVVARQGVEDRYLAPAEPFLIGPPTVTVLAQAEHDTEHFFKAVVEICRPELVIATTKALAKALEAEEQRLANPPGFV